MFKRQQKIVSVGSISSFMSGEYKDKGKAHKTQQRANVSQIEPLIKWGAVVPFAGALAVKAKTAFAAVEGMPEAIPAGAISDAAKQKIIHAFDPLIELMVDISLPISGVMLTGGALLILIGQKERGFSLILNSCLGYILVQMSPMFLSLLSGVGNAI